MAFKDRLKEARKNKGLTQEELGEAIGVAKSTVTGYEKGSSEPDMNKIFKMIKLLDVDANYFWQDDIFFNVEPTLSHIEAVTTAYRSATEPIRQAVDKLLDIK